MHTHSKKKKKKKKKKTRVLARSLIYTHLGIDID